MSRYRHKGLKWHWLCLISSVFGQCFTDCLTFYAGFVVDRIHYNGTKFGRSGGGGKKPLVIGSDEIIREFQYSKASKFYPGRLCYMIVKTDLNDYHIFDQSSGRQRYCDITPQYSVQIPSNHDLGFFLNSSIEYNHNDWIIGFKNEIKTYCIEILAGHFDGCWSQTGSGNDITLLHNGVEKFIYQSEFTDFDFCLHSNEVDVENDLFELKNGGDDGVSRNIFWSIAI